MDPKKWNKNQESELDFDPFKPGAVTKDHDPMQLHLQKSIIASTISGARATLNEPSRPFTPADLPRHLFSGNDYSERPGSAYKVGQVATDALENFTRSSTAESSAKEKQRRPTSRSRKKPVLEPIVRKREPAKKSKIVLKKAPESAGVIKTLNTFKGNKPVKVVKAPSAKTLSQSVMQAPDELNLNDCEIGKMNMQQNKDDAFKRQQELMQSIQQAKSNYDDCIDDPAEDDMEKYFLESMSSELVANSEPTCQDQYVDALSKLEEIKRNQCKEETNGEILNDNDNDQPDDDLEERLMNDIHQSMKQESGQIEESKDCQDKNKFEEEYASLIQEFQKFSRHDKPILKTISSVTDRVWNLIDDWRDQDSKTTAN